jgi:FtsP/CotA-like multicopper oxidase with cupredoxin domain
MTATGRSIRDTLLVAVLLTVGVSAWWQLAPGALAGQQGAASGVPHLGVTALLVFPLAVLAVAGGGWVTGRRYRVDWSAGRRHAQRPAPRRPVPLRAAVTAGAFAVLALVTAPIRHAVHGALAGNGALAEHGRHPAAAGPQVAVGDTATRDTLAVLGVALLLAWLGLALVRIRPAPVPPVARGRRRWGAAGAALVLLLGSSLVFAPGAQASAVPPPFSVPLRIPPVLTGPQIDLTMAQTDVQLLPSGPPTRMWTYNGMFPGPTIRRPSGQPTQVTVHNQLPVAAGSMTVHHHGSHSRSIEDGQPMDQLIPTGGQRTYTYEHRDGGAPERAATQWYHDHRMDVTGRNVWNGLAGMFILDDAVDSALPLPTGEFDVPLMIVDRSFDAGNQIPYRFNVNGTFGDTVLVNGAPQPYFEVGDRKYRFRVLNAANRRPYTLALSTGQAMTQIGTESGLLPAPVTRTQIDLFPAERAEIVIDFAGHLGQDIVLRNLAGDGPGTSQVMQFRVTRDVPETSLVPPTLRPAPTFPEPVRTRNFSLNFNVFTGTWTINGRSFDPNRVDADPVLGTTERWVFVNLTFQPHVIHIHDMDWRLESRSLQPPPPWENGLKESWRINPFERISLITTFTDNAGRYVFHCHMLEHEDRAMMAQFEVRPA